MSGHAILRRRRGARPGTAGLAFLTAFGVVAVGVGAARAVTTTYVPVLLDRIEHAPGLIGAVMLVNALAGFAVPLAVGLWSDRRAYGRLGARTPFILGGTLLTMGGLLAIALGTASSYLYLALAATAVYAGLNTTATAHRALVPEAFGDRRRPAATSAQELAMLLGGLAGLLLGGALVESSAPMLFLAVALALPLLAGPTFAAVSRHLHREPPTHEASSSKPRPRLADLAAVLKERGPREILIAQTLWVGAYAALPAFFILYASDILSLRAGTASAVLAGFGLLTGAGMLAAGRAAPERVYPLLLLGVALLGGGLLAGAAANTLAVAAVPFAAAAVGMGLVTALGFPYFARFIPPGAAGRYSGLFFSVRAVGAAAALPAAGVAIEVTGSYRWLLVQGGIALVALIPLAMAERTRRGGAKVPARRPAIRRLAAVVPCYASDGLIPVVEEALVHASEVVIVDDGAPGTRTQPIDGLAGRPGVRIVRLESNRGKGAAVAAGMAALLDTSERPDAIVVIDADGQHPSGRIPAFVAAAEQADVVIGDRRADRTAMPRIRRFTNSASSALLSLVTRRRLHDTQCGMRLYRTDAIASIPPPSGRYEAETVYLRELLRAGARVAWVPIPAIYDGADSSFRNVADTARVLGAIVTPLAVIRAAAARRERLEDRRRDRRVAWPPREFWRTWGPRLTLVVLGTWTLGAFLPLVEPLDRAAFTAINSLGAGPDWVYLTLDPHSRNYVLLCLIAVAVAWLAGPRHALAVMVAVTLAAVFSDILVQTAYVLYDRPRPEEVPAVQALLTNGRHWSHIASFPSGHMVVTTAIAVAAMSTVPALRAPMWIYVALIAITRVTFGAHFPLDVIVGLLFGFAVGRFSAAFVQSAGLLRTPLASTWPLPRTLPERRRVRIG